MSNLVQDTPDYLDEYKKKTDIKKKKRMKALLIVALVVIILGGVTLGGYFLLRSGVISVSFNNQAQSEIQETNTDEETDKYFDFIAFQIKTGKVNIDEVSGFFRK